MDTIKKLEAMLAHYTFHLQTADKLSKSTRHALMGAESDHDRKQTLKSGLESVRATGWQLSRNLAHDFEALKVTLAADIDRLMNEIERK